ncbi:protein FAR1-RELATED SEQUENCE 5-like [Vicia villosa]|uniref:protein FAR1-RELATED SEQUENCE 5-like n=1 Tax=Vicia villosa TaxID=3911 RepID=UPI00273BD2C0|nr:protein FAR1-RELATED SEQUENCE 5-like [Vicia villosa]
MTPRYIVAALKDRDSENLTSVTQVYTAKATYRTSKRGALTEMQMLLSFIHKEKYMCWTRNRDNSDVVADTFWTHLDYVKLLNMFHLVLIFDCTYKTNMYQIQLLKIVGVTPTNLTFSVAFAHLEHERKENFTWALEKLKNLFSSKILPLKVVVTNGELALMNAMEYVFPYATHMLRSFRISKNVSIKYREYVK